MLGNVHDLQHCHARIEPTGLHCIETNISFYIAVPIHQICVCGFTSPWQHASAMPCLAPIGLINHCSSDSRARTLDSFIRPQDTTRSEVGGDSSQGPGNFTNILASSRRRGSDRGVIRSQCPEMACLNLSYYTMSSLVIHSFNYLNNLSYSIRPAYILTTEQNVVALAVQGQRSVGERREEQELGPDSISPAAAQPNNVKRVGEHTDTAGECRAEGAQRLAVLPCCMTGLRLD